ncbi:MAG: helix-turn-helix domain-containing protein [Planctomycetota bacterium]
METSSNNRDLTPPQVARMMGVNCGKVGTWINTGELEAYNVSAGKRPRWRVTLEAIEAFRRRRSNTPTQPKPTRRRQIKPTTQWV